ncbi:hypothetical protein M9H77_23714 [Catharanthus roseus]|uniref:Uncharacterized protein n=1 Tax=Catharanthus roseus TaxID=4058 RepID=A0ACC0AUI2_CATRO|nr:hypothetical protein M9H77_23714 [Catharanthus roseus]
MAAELDEGTKKRKTSCTKSNSRNAIKRNKKLKKNHAVAENFGIRKMDRKMKKMLRKKARDYNSDDDDEDNGEKEAGNSEGEGSSDNEDSGEENIDEGNEDPEEVLADDDGEVQPGIMRFSDGCKSFQMAFKKITKTATTDDVLGPVLSAHKKLVIEKLAEEEAERKVKGEAKKEKRLLGEKGHLKPANYLDSHEKYLIGIATRGVVKLFNAVNKAQHAQKGLNPSRSKDEKAIKKRRKEAFFSQLSKTSSQTPGKVAASTIHEHGDGPEWAPLRDNYMLTNSKLKDWDKMPETMDVDDFRMPQDTHTSSDED